MIRNVHGFNCLIISRYRVVYLNIRISQDDLIFGAIYELFFIPMKILQKVEYISTWLCHINAFGCMTVCLPVHTFRA